MRERTTQRTDSTHVLAAVRDLTRLELITEAVRAALEEVAGTSPHLLDGLIDEDWGIRYGRPVRLGKNPTETTASGSWNISTGTERITRPVPAPRPCARSWCRTTTVTPQAACAGASPRRKAARTAAVVESSHLALRHLGPLRTARTHHQLEGIHRSPDSEDVAW